jgi:hypothetical protein
MTGWGLTNAESRGEIAAFQDDNGHVTIIYAMRLRPSYKPMYEEVMRWL